MKRNPIQQRALDRKRRLKIKRAQHRRLMNCILGIDPKDSPAFWMFEDRCSKDDARP